MPDGICRTLSKVLHAGDCSHHQLRLETSWHRTPRRRQATHMHPLSQQAAPPQTMTKMQVWHAFEWFVHNLPAIFVKGLVCAYQTTCHSKRCCLAASGCGSQVHWHLDELPTCHIKLLHSPVDLCHQATQHSFVAPNHGRCVQVNCLRRRRKCR